jgi:hypothetical protein
MKIILIGTTGASQSATVCAYNILKFNIKIKFNF